MEKVLVFADIHMCGEGQNILGLDPMERLTTALEDVAHRHPDAEHLVLLGDIVNSGKPYEYQRVKDALSRYTFKVSLLAGNHDGRDSLRAVFPQAELDASGFLQSTFDLGETRFIALDTLQEGPGVGARASGYLCELRLNWLRQTLAMSRDKRVVIFAHHPPFEVGFPNLDRINLNNGPEVMELLTSYDNVAHVLCGHVHRTISGSAGRLNFTVLKSLLYQKSMLEGAEGKRLAAISTGGYGVIHLLPDAIAVHVEDVSAAQN